MTKNINQNSTKELGFEAGDAAYLEHILIMFFT